MKNMLGVRALFRVICIGFAVVVVAVLPQFATAQPAKPATQAVVDDSAAEVQAHIAVMEQHLAQQAATHVAIPVHRGSVPMPPGYVYNLSLGARHDYCTNSPDQFPNPGHNADFSGACARHDMCFDRAERMNAGRLVYQTCNELLMSDMRQVCKDNYSSFVSQANGTLASCYATADVYYIAVTAAARMTK